MKDLIANKIHQVKVKVNQEEKEEKEMYRELKIMVIIVNFRVQVFLDLPILYLSH